MYCCGPEIYCRLLTNRSCISLFPNFTVIQLCAVGRIYAIVSLGVLTSPR